MSIKDQIKEIRNAVDNLEKAIYGVEEPKLPEDRAEVPRIGRRVAKKVAKKGNWLSKLTPKARKAHFRKMQKARWGK